MKNQLVKAFIATTLSMLLVTPSSFQAATKQIPKRAPAPKTDRQPEPNNLLRIKIATAEEDSFVVNSTFPNGSHKIVTCGYYSDELPDGNFTLGRDPRIDRFVDLTAVDGGLLQMTVNDKIVIIMPTTKKKERFVAYVVSPDSPPVAKKCSINEEGLLVKCKPYTETPPPLDALKIEMNKMERFCDWFFEEKVKGKVNPEEIETPNGIIRQLRLRNDGANLDTLLR